MAEPMRPDKSQAGSHDKARSPVQGCPNKLWVELEHGTEYPDDYDQFEPAAGTPFRLILGDGSQMEGRLDENGFARFDGIPDGDVQVEYEPDLDQRIAELKQQLRQGLNEIVEVEREEYQRIEKELQDARVFGLEFLGSNTLAQSGMYLGALLKGIGNGVVGILGFAWDVLKGSGKALYELGLRLNPITAPRKFREDLQTLKETYQELKRFADEDLEAYVILMSDPEVYAMFQKFGEDLWSTQHSLELTEAGGELTFDVALTIITGGAGTAASTRHVGKLKKLKAAIDKLVDALKRKEQRQRLDKKPPSRRIITKIQPRKVPCFCPYKGKAFKRLSKEEQKAYLQEYSRQLRRQQDAINKMTVDDYLAARDAFSNRGRNPVADELQQGARDDFREEIQQSIMKNLQEKQGLGAVEAKRQASARADAIMENLAALHEPDMVAGGWHSPNPEAMGNSSVNSAIGSSWKQKSRLTALEEQAAQAKIAGHGQEKMNVRLGVCPGARYCP